MESQRSVSSLRVLVVCLGNICRSPLGEAVLRDAAKRRNLRIQVDSAGTGGWHVGQPPDRRSIDEAHRRGVDISQQRGRKVQREDLDAFDVLLAMDQQNLKDLQSLAKNDEELRKIQLFMPDGREVPDPYHGTMRDFALVFDWAEEAANLWMEKWSKALREK